MTKNKPRTSATWKIPTAIKDRFGEYCVKKNKGIQNSASAALIVWQYLPEKIQGWAIAEITDQPMISEDVWQTFGFAFERTCIEALESLAHGGYGRVARITAEQGIFEQLPDDLKLAALEAASTPVLSVEFWPQFRKLLAESDDIQMFIARWMTTMMRTHALGQMEKRPPRLEAKSADDLVNMAVEPVSPVVPPVDKLNPKILLDEAASRFQVRKRKKRRKPAKSG